MTTGITRDEALAQEIINILFCKILDEQETEANETVTFRAGVGETPAAVRKRILPLFEKVKTDYYEDVFDKADTLKLDNESLAYVVGELQNYCVMDADRDAIGDAFEVFIGPALRGAEGQFFTPRNVVQMMVEILDPQPGDKIIDPACGSGGFLIMALEHVWKQIDAKADKNEWKDERRYKEKVRVAVECFRGMDKDSFLAKVCKAYMALVGDGRGGVFCANSLQPPEEWLDAMQSKIGFGTFDVVLTNPPFGKNIVVKGIPLLSQYDLGYRWKKDKAAGTWKKQTALFEDQPPQIIFINRCLQLLRPGGRMGIVLPEAVFGMPTYEYVVAYLCERTKIRGVISMPEALFKTSGKGGTHAKVCVLFIEKTKPEKDDDWPVFMADVKWCGHDSRGNPTIRIQPDGTEVLLDDVPGLAAEFKRIIGSW
jgi:type I restriction enzyme M protein